VKYFEEKTRMEDRPVETRRSEFASARKGLPPGEGEAIVATNGRPDLSDEEAAELLGVTPDAPERVVETAYQEAVKSEHPDQGDGGDVDRVQTARDQLLGE
jgi:DnaJ-domain-containing protein 1